MTSPPRTTPNDPSDRTRQRRGRRRTFMAHSNAPRAAHTVTTTMLSMRTVCIHLLLPAIFASMFGSLALAAPAPATMATRPSATSPSLGPPPPWLAYVQQADPRTSMRLKSQRRGVDQRWTLDAALTSQQWQGALWNHNIRLVLPPTSPATDVAVVFLGELPPHKTLAKAVDETGLACASMDNLPSPSFGYDVDHLLAYAAGQYLKTQDASWSPAAPMVKAVMRGLDALQDLSAREGNHRRTQFILVGHGRMGWTAWMAAAADPRVIGIVVLGCDDVNLPAQSASMPAPALADPPQQLPPFLRDANLPGLRNRTGRALLAMIDPYTYRQRIAVPKLIISGGNDELSDVGAVDRFWPGLVGPRYRLMLANTEHSAEPSDAKAFSTIFQFARLTALGRPMPQFIATFEPLADQPRFELNAPSSAQRAVVWYGSTTAHDYHKTFWSPRPMTATETRGAYRTFTTDVPKAGPNLSAAYAEIEFEVDAHAFWLSTRVYKMGW